MEEEKCTFCGSKTQTIETPFVVLNNKGEYVKKTQACCRWSGQNNKWIKRHENPITHEKPNMKDVIKW